MDSSTPPVISGKIVVKFEVLEHPFLSLLLFHSLLPFPFLNPTRESGECSKFPQCGPGWNHGCKCMLVYFELKNHAWRQRFWFFYFCAERMIVFTARRYASAVHAVIVYLFVCPSVCYKSEFYKDS